ncbi:hypothetical protein SD70_12605 [Gordoniibacillus kamchatkensis]|uniref:GIY-YIG domain-containing protein n=1 Tax=Gordoniibacillus kamchatkensis TaxID=1590651 RepID=A0ABR5AIE0_9BACL|nr:GIY-YIG nuclease family protein [Paenibacillus sp. VKM B-2647]KIL40583.1 hypothetical protein SD70_12605 [Paenibacillus sp. VKM B-2647]
MPSVTLTWYANNVFEPHSEQYGVNDWIYQLVWRNSNNTMLPTSAGLYVIEHPAGSPIYSGSSTDIRNRFNLRPAYLNTANQYAANAQV